MKFTDSELTDNRRKLGFPMKEKFGKGLHIGIIECAIYVRPAHSPL